jgi:tetratricopeptide (TPR) repeat protein
MTRLRRCHGLALLLIAPMFLAACQRDPNTSVARADQYMTGGKHKEAIIEYRRALQRAPRRADVHYKLAKAYMAVNDLPNAYSEYSAAADLDPSMVDAQVQSGQLLLVAGEYERAKARAEGAIAVDPRNVPARILLGNALAGLNDTVQAMKQMEEAVALDPASAPAHAALGSVQFAARNPSARASFEKAVAIEPRSVDSWLALANYDWAAGDHAAAERDLKSALEIDADNAGVRRALALLYLTDKRPQEAEPHFQALAAQSAAGGLALADYYNGLGRHDEALRILEPLAKDAKVERVARMRMAATLRQQGRRTEALALADTLVKERPSDADAHSLKARLLLSPPADPAGAWVEANEAVKANQDSAPAHYSVGLAALARRDLDAAEKAFEQTLKLNPRAAAAQLQIARIRLARGDAAAALTAAEEVVSARPDDAEATVVLARSLRARGEHDRARRALTTQLEKSATDLPMTLELGWVELAAGRPREARGAFERAITLDARNEEARTGVVAADLAAREPAKARARVTQWLAADPADPGAQVLAARVDIVEGADATAEQRLVDVLRAHPARLDAYEILAAHYVSKGNTAAALEKYRALANLAADTPGPATMVGILLDSMGDPAGARAQYEAVLARFPRAAVAANNLAWMLAERGELSDALRWARVAVESMRARPEPQDTLGWIHLKANRPLDALAAFEKAASMAPQNRTYREHADAARAAIGGK